MLTRLFGFATLTLFASSLAGPTQQPHQIRLRHPREDVYLFDPARITAKPGERLVFTVEGGGPYVIGFEPADLDAQERELIDAAIPGRSGELRSPLLPRAGSRFEMTLPALPRGTYRFAAVTHLAYQMAGVLVVP